MKIGKKNTALYRYTDKIKKIFKKGYERFLKIRGNPREIAYGIALGLFVGMSPTIGFQTAIALFFAAVFKINKISAVIGVWITNPVTAPLIYSITYYIGGKIIGNSNSINNPEHIEEGASFLNMIFNAHEIFWIMSVGGIVLGIPLSVAGYIFSYSAIKKYQEEIKQKLLKQKQKLKEIKEKVKEKRKKKKTRRKRKKQVK